MSGAALPGAGAGPPPRSAGRKLAGLLATTALTVLAVSVPITQWMAGRLGHHPKLGAPWFDGWYAPWSWIQWRMAGWPTPGAARTYELLDGGLMMAVCALPMLAGWALSQKKNKPRKHEGVHGTARLAQRADLEAARLLPERAGILPRRQPEVAGWYLAAHEEKDGSLTYIRHDGPDHLGVFGPPRCGKTAGPVVMNCLSGEAESLVVFDTKGSIYRDTAGWRKSAGQKVLRWDLMATENRVRWNPLREVRLGTIHEYSDAATIIEHVADPSGEGLDGGRDHFPPVAAELLSGLTLFVLYERRSRGEWACLADVLRALADPDREPVKLYKAMAENRCGPGGARHEEIASAGAAQLKRPDKERGSVHSTAGRMLRLFRDPIVARNTAASDFSIADIMDAEHPVSLYVIPREEHRLRLRPLTRLFVSLMGGRLASVETVKGSNRPHRHSLRFIYDEFPADGAQEYFVSFMARCPEYGIRVMVLAQDYQQITKEYGPNETVTGVCTIKLGYTPANGKTAEWMSEWSGRETRITEDVSESGSTGDAKRGFNRAYHTVSRQLLTPDEVERIPTPAKDGAGGIVSPGRVLIKVAGMQTALETQACYFFDPTFSARAAIPAPPTDTMRRAA